MVFLEVFFMKHLAANGSPGAAPLRSAQTGRIRRFVAGTPESD